MGTDDSYQWANDVAILRTYLSLELILFQRPSGLHGLRSELWVVRKGFEKVSELQVRSEWVDWPSTSRPVKLLC